jgi:hypothetical protein
MILVNSIQDKIDKLWKEISEKFAKDIDDLIKIQRNEAPSSGYMAGLANGLIVAKSCITGEDPALVENPDAK